MKILYGIIIIVFSAAAAWIGSDLYQNISGPMMAKGWAKTPATLVSWDIKSFSRFMGGKVLQIETKEIVAKYTYQVGGQTFENSKIGFGRVSDNFSDAYRNNIVARLKASSLEGSPFFVWVDPQNPLKSVIERDIPFQSAIFKTFFLIFPLGLATIFVVSVLFSLFKKAFHGHPEKFSLPVWAILHGSPLFLIMPLKPEGSVGFVVWVLAAVIAMVFIGGVWGLYKALNSDVT